MIRIYDGVLHLRRALEKDTSGFPLRNLWIEALNRPPGEIDIWVFDGRNNNARRREVYPEYKANREPAAEDIMAFVQLWKELVRFTPAFSVEIAGWEADDVIGHLACRYAIQGQPVYVITRDADIRQLEQVPGIRVVTDSLKDIEPAHIRLYKATVGDSSDNIKGVPGFGAKTFESCDKAALKDWFEAVTDEVPADLPAKVKNAMASDPAFYRSIYRIVGFLPIDPDEVTRNIVPGQNDPDTVARRLAQYLQ